MSGNNYPKIAKYIQRHAGDLSISERQDILQMIINSSISDSKIKTKGDGTLCKIKDIPRNTIMMIYTYIQTKLSNKIAALQFFPDVDDESSDETAVVETAKKRVNKKTDSDTCSDNDVEVEGTVEGVVNSTLDSAVDSAIDDAVDSAVDSTPDSTVDNAIDNNTLNSSVDDNTDNTLDSKPVAKKQINKKSSRSVETVPPLVRKKITKGKKQKAL